MDIINYMKNSINHDCYRCQINGAYFHCSECQNAFFCIECNSLVHSLSTKRHHKRRLIAHKREESDYSTCSLRFIRPSSPVNDLHDYQPKTYQRSSSTLDVMNNNINLKKNPQNCCSNDLNNKINEEEKEELLSTIKILKQKLSDTTSTLNEKIEYLYSQIEDLKKRYIEEMEENNQRQIDLLDNIQLEKDDKINFLYEKVYQLEEMNAKQSNKIEEYKELLNENQCNLRDKIALANCHLDELMNENALMKEFYEMKIGNISNISAEEKNRIENTYEKSIETLKVGYETSKLKHMEIIQKREKEIKELMEKYKKEKTEMTEAINKLRETNDKHLREKIELIKTNNSLKKTIDEDNDSIYNLKNDVKEHLKEKRLLNEQLEKVKVNNENLASKSEKLNHMLFGRFKRKKTSIEK